MDVLYHKAQHHDLLNFRCRAGHARLSESQPFLFKVFFDFFFRVVPLLHEENRDEMTFMIQLFTSSRFVS